MELQRHWGVAEANAMLPLVRESFERVRPLHKALQQRAVELAEVEKRITEDDEASRVTLLSERAELHRMALQIHRILRGLTERGVEVKDVDGLVDFRSHYQGRVVYLCWRWNEPEIACFHELSGGFAGRQLLGDPHQFTGDLVH